MIVNVYNFLYRCIMIFIITTITQSLWPFSINQVIGFFIFITIVYISFLKQNKKNLIKILLSLFSTCFLFIFTEDLKVTLTNSVYWLNAIMLLLLSSNKGFVIQMYKTSLKLNKYTYKIIFVANIILLISLIMPSCYNFVWGSSYFRGFTFSQHTLSSACCLLLATILLYLFVNKSLKKRSILDISYFIPGILSILQSGARTFLIPAFIILILFYKYYLNKKNIKIIILPIISLIFLYIIFNSNAFLKFKALSAHQDMNAMTSGRLEFWEADLMAFKNLNIFNKIFGNGFKFITEINYNAVGIAIGAHNDYLTCLLGLGILGVIIYIVSIYTSFKFLIKEKVCIFLIVLQFIYLFIPSFVNGFYGYQSMMFSYIFLVLILLVISKKRRDVFK